MVNQCPLGPVVRHCGIEAGTAPWVRGTLLGCSPTACSGNHCVEETHGTSLAGVQQVVAAWRHKPLPPAFPQCQRRQSRRIVGGKADSSTTHTPISKAAFLPDHIHTLPVVPRRNGAKGQPVCLCRFRGHETGGAIGSARPTSSPIRPIAGAILMACSAMLLRLDKLPTQLGRLAPERKQWGTRGGAIAWG